MDPIHLAIDAMGGDFGPRVTVPAALEFLHRNSQVTLNLYGDEAEIRKALATAKKLAANAEIARRLAVSHAPQIVGNDEKPSSAIRHKRESSMWQVVDAVASGSADACVSAGNTGALMAMGLIQIGAYDGIERPAICTAVPSIDRNTYLLDAGANLECSPELLRQFARMATCLVSAVESVEFPAVGLLNVGSEELKGGRQLQETAELLSSDGAINYTGFVEGDDLYLGKVDVVVCDGFIGNIALKAGEGVAKMIAQRLQRSFRRSLGARVAGMVARGVLKAFQRRIDPAGYNGASLLGLKGVVVKSHGAASQESFISALTVAFEEARTGLPGKIEQSLSNQIDEPASGASSDDVNRKVE